MLGQIIAARKEKNEKKHKCMQWTLEVTLGMFLRMKDKANYAI